MDQRIIFFVKTFSSLALSQRGKIRIYLDLV